MKVEIVYKRKKETKTVEFNGTNAMAQGMQFIYNNQPCEIVTVRLDNLSNNSMGN